MRTVHELIEQMDLHTSPLSSRHRELFIISNLQFPHLLSQDDIRTLTPQQRGT